MQCLDPIADPGNVGSGVAREDGIEAGRCPLRYHGVGHGTDEAGWLSQCHGLTGFRLTLYTCTQHSTQCQFQQGAPLSGVTHSWTWHGLMITSEPRADCTVSSTARKCSSFRCQSAMKRKGLGDQVEAMSRLVSSSQPRHKMLFVDAKCEQVSLQVLNFSRWIQALYPHKVTSHPWKHSKYPYKDLTANPIHLVWSLCIVKPNEYWLVWDPSYIPQFDCIFFT